MMSVILLYPTQKVKPVFHLPFQFNPGTESRSFRGKGEHQVLCTEISIPHGDLTVWTPAQSFLQVISAKKRKLLLQKKILPFHPQYI